MLFAACVLSWGCALQEPPPVVTGSALGTSYRLALNCDVPPSTAKRVTEAAFASVDRSMSTYRQDSELMRFNRSELGHWHTMSAEFAAVLEESIEVGRLTNGAFDPTLGALVNLWGFGGGQVPVSIPSAREVDRRLSQTGLAQLEIRNTPLESSEPLKARRHADFSLDLSAIAKGYAVDLAIEALENNACRDLLLELGGEVGVRGTRPDGKSWSVGIESPSPSGGVVRALALSNEAIATSGDYRNQVKIEGRVFSHTLDPTTGYPVRHGLASVSVISANAMRADALATALNVMGPERGLDFARRHQLEAYFIIRTDTGYRSEGTGRFERM